MQFDQLDIWNTQVILLDLAIVVGLIVSLKFLKGVLANVHSQKELVENNNAAFGISFGGAILALAVMLTGVSSGDEADSLMAELSAMLGFGVLGMVLILLGRIIQDKLVLRQIDIHGELAKGNIACALVDVGHMLAVGIIVRSVMVWVPSSDLSIVSLLLVAFVLSQLVMVVASLYRVKLFKVSNNDGSNCLQTAVVGGNSALALRYAAFSIGAALVVTTASHLVEFSPAEYWLSAVTWAGVALVSIPIYAVIAVIIRKLVLSGVDVAQEVDREQNMGVAAVEGAIFIALSLVLSALI
ncbi:DUF350 domain-containing protein [Aliikangiella sp. IMCC44632]